MFGSKIIKEDLIVNSNVNEVFQSLESNGVQALQKNLTSNPSLANVENEQGMTPLIKSLIC